LGQVVTGRRRGYGLGCFFRRGVGGLDGIFAGPEGIDLSHQPSVGYVNALFFGLHVGVLAAQVGELPGDIADCLVLACGVDLPGVQSLSFRGFRLVSLPFQFADPQLQPLA
jgi:hypothetical protein